MRSLRSHISFVLALGLMIGLLWQTTTIIHFYLNRESIAAEHCINKNNPEKPDCKGQCHLQSQLEQASTAQEKSVDGVPIGGGSVLFLLFKTENNPSLFTAPPALSWPVRHKIGEVVTFYKDIFHPPRFAV